MQSTQEAMNEGDLSEMSGHVFEKFWR